jgi:hypothetical protein
MKNQEIQKNNTFLSWSSLWQKRTPLYANLNKPFSTVGIDPLYGQTSGPNTKFVRAVPKLTVAQVRHTLKKIFPSKHGARRLIKVNKYCKNIKIFQKYLNLKKSKSFFENVFKEVSQNHFFGVARPGCL